MEKKPLCESKSFSSTLEILRLVLLLVVVVVTEQKARGSITDHYDT